MYVEGRLTSRTYVGNDGETRISLDVNASEVRFLDSRNSSPPSSDAGVQSPTSENSENFDELPW